MGAEGAPAGAAAQLAGSRRGGEGAGRQPWAGLWPLQETGPSWKLGDDAAGARAAPADNLFPPRAQQEGLSGTGGVSGWPHGVTLVTVGGGRP